MFQKIRDLTVFAYSLPFRLRDVDLAEATVFTDEFVTETHICDIKCLPLYYKKIFTLYNKDTKKDKKKIHSAILSSETLH